MSRYAAVYEIEVRHPGLSKFRMLRGSNRYEVEQRAAALRAQWDDEWTRRRAVEDRRQQRLGVVRLKEDMKREAAERTEAAEKQLSSLSTILIDGLRNPSPFEWDLLKDRSQFPERKPTPSAPEYAPNEPVRSSEKYNPALGILDILIPPRKRKLEETAQKVFDADHAEWRADCDRIKRKNVEAEASFQRDLAAWEQQKSQFEQERIEQHASVDARSDASNKGDENAFNEHLDLALSHLTLPDCINFNARVDYCATTKTCVIDVELPSPELLPTLKEVKFVQARNEFVEKHISEAERGRLYDSVLYQMALRTIVGVFAADQRGHLQRATLNGWVDYVDRASGMDERSCILSVAVNRADIDRIDFERVDPKECFRSLKGVAASKLIGLAPVAPLERPRIADSRFVESQEVASTVNAGVNLAAMDWKDFEHLVRQVFENEFSSPGSEVRVTQASRDGGVDAIVFDPDPIKGGKIVIQAKRYTNTVDVSAVRDLYGTVHNEGATKGILVTTSQFGPDARKFAQGKPLSLIDGSNLLFLLEKMGVAARIDLKEAKMLLMTSN